MKIKSLIFLICSIPLFGNYIFGQNNIRIAKYKGDKECAISYTFDDGLSEQYSLVFPRLEKLNLKCTFFINGSKINQNEKNITDTTRVTWGQLKKMSKKGHEISNHGWAHKNFARHTLDQIREDISKNDSAIFANIGIMPQTFCYPNNNKQADGYAIAILNRVGTRTFQKAIGGKSTSTNLEEWVNSLIANKDWGVGMTHGITYGYDAFKDSDIFWEHLEKVKAMENSVWVATFHNVASYIKERDNTSLDIKRNGKNIEITPQLLLDPTLFSMPLTIVIDKNNTDNISSIKQGGKKLLFKVLSDKILFDFNPFGESVIIRYK